MHDGAGAPQMVNRKPQGHRATGGGQGDQAAPAERRWLKWHSVPLYSRKLRPFFFLTVRYHRSLFESVPGLQTQSLRQRIAGPTTATTAVSDGCGCADLSFTDATRPPPLSLLCRDAQGLRKARSGLAMMLRGPELPLKCTRGEYY